MVKSSRCLVVTLLHNQWRPGKGWNTSLNIQPRVFTLEPESAFSSHFDMVQEQLETLASMDDLLSGKKTKNKQCSMCVYMHETKQLGHSSQHCDCG